MNLGIASSRCSALDVCLASAIPLASELLSRLKAHGLATGFAGPLNPSLPPLYRHNGVENMERQVLNRELGQELDAPEGRLRITKTVLNGLAIDTDRWPSVASDLPGDSGLREEDLEYLAWLSRPWLRAACH